MAEFNMMLRGREVQVKATIQSMSPIQFTVELRDKDTAEELDWLLSREELKQIALQAAKSTSTVQ